MGPMTICPWNHGGSSRVPCKYATPTHATPSVKLRSVAPPTRRWEKQPSHFLPLHNCGVATCNLQLLLFGCSRLLSRPERKCGRAALLETFFDAPQLTNLFTRSSRWAQVFPTEKMPKHSIKYEYVNFNFTFERKLISTGHA